MSAGSARRTASSISRADSIWITSTPAGSASLRRAADQRDARAQRGGLGGDGRALLAGGAVGDVAHRIDRLVRRAAGDQHVAAGERTIGASAFGQDCDERASIAVIASISSGTSASRPGPASPRSAISPTLGPTKAMPSDCELGDVAPGGRMQPHARVHGRRHQHRLVGGHQHAGGEIVGMAAGHLGQQVGGGRRDHDQIGLARQADVADLALVVEIEQLGEDAVVGERADRQRRDELLRRLRSSRRARRCRARAAAGSGRGTCRRRCRRR